VLIGVHRGTPGGARAIDLLLGTYPTATVIVFGSVDDATQLTAALTRGARGLMLWSNIGGYEPAVPGRPGRSRLDGSRIVLTRRELQVLRCMSNGKSNLDTGRDLFLSEDTIKTHARALFQKLGARDRAHAVALGLRHGLLG
jgi:DNA-binding NarL/FixJ family response regulator